MAPTSKKPLPQTHNITPSTASASFQEETDARTTVEEGRLFAVRARYPGTGYRPPPTEPRLVTTELFRRDFTVPGPKFKVNTDGESHGSALNARSEAEQPTSSRSSRTKEGPDT